jgi:N-acetylglucosamine-6-phosphate deacetylase
MKSFDLQTNGYAGVDFNGDDLNAESLAIVCAALKEDGVGGVLATIITDDVDVMCRRIERLVRLREKDPEWSEMIRGFHIEGPFLNESLGFIGAHPVVHARVAEVSVADRLLDAAEGLTRIVTLAPERDTGFSVTKHLTDKGVCVAAGHCDPTLEELRGAIDAGLRMFTHLGNGCPMDLNRHDNIIQRVLALREELWISFIPDGAHVPFATLRNYLDLVGIGKIVMVTDAIAAARMGPGDYRFLGRDVRIGSDLVARAPDGSHLIGSTVTMPRIADNLSRELGFSEAEIRKVIVENPRTVIGEAR